MTTTIETSGAIATHANTHIDVPSVGELTLPRHAREGPSSNQLPPQQKGLTNHHLRSNVEQLGDGGAIEGDQTPFRGGPQKLELISSQGISHLYSSFEDQNSNSMLSCDNSVNANNLPNMNIADAQAPLRGGAQDVEGTW